MRIPAETVCSSSERVVTASFSVIPVSDAQALRVSRHPDEWSPDDVYAYVCEEIVRLNGPQLPSGSARQTIEEFCSRFGIPVAVRIARAAFEVHSGRWQGAPITWRRFAPGHDDYFAGPVLAAMG